MNYRLPFLTARLCLPVAGMVLASVQAFAADKLPADQKVARGLEVLMTADAIPSPEGFRPKPGRPIHYLFSQTQQSLGEAIAGIKLPDSAIIEKAIVAELAKQGFVRTAVDGPVPEIFILAIIGDANFEEPFFDDLEFAMYRQRVDVSKVMMDYGIGPQEFDSERRRLSDAITTEALRLRYRDSPRFKDEGKIKALIGISKMNRAYEGGALSFFEAEKLAWASNENRYYVSLNAFDAGRWAKKERVLLWRTNMSIDWRKNFAAELPTMLAHAGPLFGTDVAVPTFVDGQTRRRAEVEIGEVKVVPDEKPASAETKKE